MTDNRNTILAVILSGLVLIGWQYFFNLPQMEKQRALQAQSEAAKPAAQAGSPAGSTATPQAGTPASPASTGSLKKTRLERFRAKRTAVRVKKTRQKTIWPAANRIE